MNKSRMNGGERSDEMNRKKEGGYIVLESAVALMFCVFILVFMLSFSFLLYQHVMVKVVASEAAQAVSEVYKFRDRSEATGITDADIQGIGNYRYLFHGGDFERRNFEKVKTFTDVRLTKTTLAQEAGGVTVTLKVKNDGIGRRHLEVTARQNYTFLLGGILRLIGFERTHLLESTAAVNQEDILYYINQVKFTKYGINKLTEASSVLSMIDKAIGFWHEVFGG
ncbi:hypothetical protein B6K86_07755 [Lachnospiraceae bacterium]|nr:hypothetical protein B6K86_07755 [Lachnospiraceae bacterium]